VARLTECHEKIALGDGMIFIKVLMIGEGKLKIENDKSHFIEMKGVTTPFISYSTGY
jgi:hypothetical protein